MQITLLNSQKKQSDSDEVFLDALIPNEILGIVFDQIVNQSQPLRDISSLLLTCKKWKLVLEKNPCISLVQTFFQLENSHPSTIKFPQECLTIEQKKRFTPQEFQLIDRFQGRRGKKFEKLLMVDSKLFHSKSLFLSLLDHFLWDPEVCKDSANKNIQDVAKEQLFILNSLTSGTDDQILTIIKNDSIEKLYHGNRCQAWEQARISVISTLKKNFSDFNDNKIFIQVARCFGDFVFYIHDSLKKDREIISIAVQQDGRSLQFADKSLKKDREIVLAAVKQNGKALYFADESLKKDREIVLAAVKQHALVLECADESLKKNREIVLTAVKQYGLVLEFADESLKKDREIVLTAVQQQGRALQFADGSLKKYREIVLTAIKQDGGALQYADESLKKDREIVLTAVQQRGTALIFTDKNLKKDREIVLAAVQQRGTALIFADESFKKDREIVLAAVKQRGTALIFADAILKKDREIVLAAVQQNDHVLQFVNLSLQMERTAQKILRKKHKQSTYTQ